MAAFVDAYKQAFARDPYDETYTDDQVIEGVWKPHLQDGIIMVVTDEEARGKLVGFGCAVPFSNVPQDVKQFLDELSEGGELPSEFDHRSAWYMSELGVVDDYIGEGAAWELVKQRMRSIDRRSERGQFFMRTAAVGSNSKPMYLKMGAKELPVLQDLTGSDQVEKNKSHSDHRIYLWGDCGEIATNIDVIQEERGGIPFISPDDEQLPETG